MHNRIQQRAFESGSHERQSRLEINVKQVVGEEQWPAAARQPTFWLQSVEMIRYTVGMPVLNVPAQFELGTRYWVENPGDI